MLRIGQKRDWLKPQLGVAFKLLVIIPTVVSEAALMCPLDLVKLAPLMQRTSGRAEVKVAVIDGPVAVAHPDLSGARIHEVPGRLGAACARVGSAACTHGTFVAGILSANRASSAPAICPD